MGEKPQAMIKKKKNSSLRIAFELVKNDEAQAIVSAGNSGGAPLWSTVRFKKTLNW